MSTRPRAHTHECTHIIQNTREIDDRLWMRAFLPNFILCLYLYSIRQVYAVHGNLCTNKPARWMDFKWNRWTRLYLLTATTETGYIDSDTNSVMYRDIIKVLTKLVAKRFGLTTIRSCDGDDCWICACWLLLLLWLLLFL